MRKLDGGKFTQNLCLSFIFIAFTLRFLIDISWEVYIIVGIPILFICVLLSLKP
jgi:hypothetical protein